MGARRKGRIRREPITGSASGKEARLRPVEHSNGETAGRRVLGFGQGGSRGGGIKSWFEGRECTRSNRGS